MGSTRMRVKNEEKEKLKELKKAEEKKEKPKVERKDQQEMRQIVRVIGTDLDGARTLKMSLTKIKGISFSMSNSICNAIGFDPRMKLGDLKEDQLQKIEDAIKNPGKYGIPV